MKILSIWALLPVLLLATVPVHAGNDPEQQFTFAQGLCQRKMYALAIPELNKFLLANAKHPQAAAAAYLLGSCYFHLEDWDKAATAYARALKQYPNNTAADGARFALGQCYFQLEQFDKAAAAFSTLLTQSKDPKMLAQAQYWLGESEFSRKRYSQAEAAYRAVIAKYPQSELLSYAYYSLGMCAAEQGDIAAALNAFETVTRRFPQFEALDEVRVMQGDALRRLKRFPEARAAYAPILASESTPALR
ncbi:MAG TPA: tetratricopeptide repeat protein, partial [Armatimonadota bacterium]|nr:tetratricopeptide repeat protein [Armatimonadota bacterium]